MDELSERVIELAVKYLIAETRDFHGVIDKKKQAKVLVHMLGCSEVKSIFGFINSSNDWREKEYRNRLEKMLENRNEWTLEVVDRQRSEIFEQIVVELIAKSEEEAQVLHATKEHLRLRQQVEELRVQLEFGKASKDVTLWDRLNSRVNLLYLVILCLTLIILIWGLVIIGIRAKMAVNVDFNIGEIIGGLLIGTGAAAAGISYATRNDREENTDNE